MMEGKLKGEVESAIFQAAAKGDTMFIANNKGREVSCFRTPGTGNTIVHIAVRHGHLEFIAVAVSLFPDLLQEKNHHGCTPLHVAAQMGTQATVKRLISHIQDQNQDQGNSNTSGSATPAVVPYILEVNCEKDTAFHVAFRCRNLSVAEELISCAREHPQIFLMKDNSLQETPLHLYVRYCAGGNLPEKIERCHTKQTLVGQLIEANYMAIFEADLEGLNPLTRAAQYGRVFPIYVMLSSYPQFMDCQDSTGKCFLHHLRLHLRVTDLSSENRRRTLRASKKILEVPGVDALICSRDKDGNTPLDLAILNRDLDVAEMILERCVEGNLSAGMSEFITSTEKFQGKTTLDLLTSMADLPPLLKTLMKQALQDRKGGRITHVKWNNVIKVLDQCSELNDDVIVSQDINGENILHRTILSYHEPFSEKHVDCKYKPFVKECIKKFPKLVYQKDSNGDTPLHVAARLSSEAAKIFLKESLGYCKDRRKVESADKPDLELRPWKVKNSRGHTPIHEAACADNKIGLETMIADDALSASDQTEALLDVNKHGENVFHLLARHIKNPDRASADTFRKEADQSRQLLEDLAKKCESGGCMRDVDGFTPSLRAAYYGRAVLVSELIDFPKAKNMRDFRGRNVLHHLCTSALTTTADLNHLINKLWEDADDADDELLLLAQDEYGNTPLHLAIMHHHFELAHSLIKHYAKARKGKESSNAIIRELKERRNKQGESVMHYLIRHHSRTAVAANLKKLLEQFGPSRMMDKELHDAATKGDLNYIKKVDDEDDVYALQRQTHDGSNILHLALRNHHSDIIQHVLNDYFELIYWKDSKGHTPLHLAVALQTEVAFTFLEACIEKWTSEFSTVFAPPWSIKNSNGNTYLHEAARLCNYQLINSKKLKNEDINDVNDLGETVLHVIVRYATNKETSDLQNLIKEMHSLIYIQDVDGFTPVLRAMQYGRLGVAKLLIKQCPRSIEIPDNKGRTVLHQLRALVVDHVDEVKDILPVWDKFFRLPGIDDLRTEQDEDGNTPLHLAIIDGDFTKTKFLMKKCLEANKKRELDIINKEGHSIYDLVSSQDHIPAMKEFKSFVSRRYVKEQELMDNVMNGDSYERIMNYNVLGQNNRSMDDAESRPPRQTEIYRQQTPGGCSIVHIALHHGMTGDEKLRPILENYPELSMRPDSNGDTPLHLAAKWKSALSLVNLLIETSKNYLDRMDESQKGFNVEPWAVKNHKGCFPIHEALQTSNLDAAKALLGCDNKAAFRVNDLGDTALHSFAQNGFSLEDYPQVEKFVTTLINNNSQAAYVRNDEGLTPLLTAARSGCLQVVRAILTCCPLSAYLRDASGRTFLHLLRFTSENVDESLDGTFKETGKTLFKIPETNAQRFVQDYDGNTPLHYAIIEENSIVAIVLTQKCLEDEERRELKLVNKQGQTISDLLAEHDVPNEIIKLIQKKVPKAVNLARSSYGIRKTEMKDSASALSVVAGLLATITFAAAFQVPGGFGDGGFPVLGQKPVFAIFTVANTVAMCSSMLCLFLLLWVMGIGKIHGSLKVLDVSIILLRISFYFTLLTFTTGVFVATAEKSLWLGILVCVLGFLTFLLTFKFSIKTVAKHGGHAADIIGDIIKSLKSQCKAAVRPCR